MTGLTFKSTAVSSSVFAVNSTPPSSGITVSVMPSMVYMMTTFSKYLLLFPFTVTPVICVGY